MDDDEEEEDPFQASKPKRAPAGSTKRAAPTKKHRALNLPSTSPGVAPERRVASKPAQRPVAALDCDDSPRHHILQPPQPTARAPQTLPPTPSPPSSAHTATAASPRAFRPQPLPELPSQPVLQPIQPTPSPPSSSAHAATECIDLTEEEDEAAAFDIRTTSVAAWLRHLQV